MTASITPADTGNGTFRLRLQRLGIDTHDEPVIYLRDDCPICRSEGFNARSRVQVRIGKRSVLATLNVVHSRLLEIDEAGLSEAAWHLLSPSPDERVELAHPEPVESFRAVRGKLYGQRLSHAALGAIIKDIVRWRYSDVQLSAFVAACANDHLNQDEINGLTRAMVDVGERLEWPHRTVLDKHCVGGLPGNRTTPLVVAIVCALGLTIPKTSSRAITSPAGTADTMEMLAPVELSLDDMRAVVEQEGGCVVWGGSARLSPADDILIRIERALELDSDPQLVASILSKKAAAGSNHVLIDIPVGPAAKIRSQAQFDGLASKLRAAGRAVGVEVAVLQTAGDQPVGRGIGPALEARDLLAVLRGEPSAPRDLRERAVTLAGRLLELAGTAAQGQGEALAGEVLGDGRAWTKFQAICAAQGGMRSPPSAAYTEAVPAALGGTVEAIDNLGLARTAKLAGAPSAPAAGIDLHVHLGDRVERGEPLFTVHAESRGELAYALAFLEGRQPPIGIRARA